LDAENITADYTAGVLTLRIPVLEAAKPRKVAISTKDAPALSAAS
jgi:HSP20 family protein